VDVLGSASIARLLDKLSTWLRNNCIRYCEKPSTDYNIPLHHLVLAQRANALLVNSDRETLEFSLECIPVQLCHSSVNGRWNLFP
jgi:hypothetical protein